MSPLFKPKEKIITPRKKQSKKTFCQKYGPKACCKKCCFHMFRCCSKGATKYINKKIFGAAEVNPIEYDIAGINADTFVEKLKENKSLNELFRNKKFSLTEISENVEMIRGMNVNSLINKFSVKGSRAKYLEHMVQDYKNIASLTGLKKKSKVDTSKLNKEKLKEMLDDYISRRKKSKVLSEKKFDFYGFNPDDLKRISVSKKSQFNLDDLNKHKSKIVVVKNKDVFVGKKISLLSI